VHARAQRIDAGRNGGDEHDEQGDKYEAFHIPTLHCAPGPSLTCIKAYA
jgi:hypothetical protein